MRSKKLFVVIAEDDADDSELVSHSFKNCGYFTKIELVTNGIELMTLLNKERLSPPDIVLTDLNMPMKDGYEALLEISNDLDFKKIPVFVYSTTMNPDYVLKCKNLGARDFLIKPFHMDEINQIPLKILDCLDNN